MRDDNVGFIGVVILVIACVSFIAIDAGRAKTELIGTGKVVEKSFQGSRVSTGITTNGDLAITSDSEHWTLIVEHDGEIMTFEVDKSKWASFDRGSTCHLYRRVGAVFTYGTSLEK